MARTQRPNTDKLKVAYWSVKRTLNIHRSDSDEKSIQTKTMELLRKHKLSLKGKLGHQLNRLFKFYEKNPDLLPTWNELNLYKDDIT